MMTVIAIFFILVFFYSLGSRKLEQTALTAPMLFTAAGIACFFILPGLRGQSFNRNVSLWITELGLVFLLYTDASRTDLKVLKNIQNLPARLLSVGMLLTLLLGAVGARLILPQLSWWEAGILAAILAPTDAGLGQVIVSSPLVPMRIRQALNVEAGLNDGLSVPFMLFFIALAVASGKSPDARLGNFILAQLGVGILIGLGIGLAGGYLLSFAARAKSMAASYQQIGVVTLPILCAIASEAAGASMFIAAFVAGLAVQVHFREAGQHSVEFAEEWGQLINLFVFYLFGMLGVPSARDFTLAVVGYALFSLTVARMLPVTLALWGTGLSRASVIFMGWFGPRGLASIVLGLVYLEHETHLPGEATMRLAVIATVSLSILAHGLSAKPGISVYEKRLAMLADSAPERT
ncbi:MAG: cation:proton antiporter [Terriglobia bacterium]